MTRLFEAAPFLIAEIGSNWRTLEEALDSISVAKDCGADAAKFQLFSKIALYGFSKRLEPWSLPLDWLPLLKERADQVGIEFMCTAFSPELVTVVDPFVLVHKVASSDSCWPQLLEAAKATGKPVLLSTGATTGSDLVRAAGILGTNFIAMSCVASYPADCMPLFDYNGEGLSDHTLGYSVAVESARRGASVIEKHFTAFPDLDTPDRPHSLTHAQFKAMVHLIRTGEPPDQEREFRLRHKRRLIATCDVAIGATLKYGETFGAYRCLEDDTRGLSPFRWAEVEGKLAAVDIKRGTPIGEGDFR